MTEAEHARYGRQTLKQLHDQLKQLGQFKKYPRELAWVKWELEREETEDALSKLRR